jgi:hypothetical protein
MVDTKAFVSASTNHEYFNPFARLTKPDGSKDEAGEKKQQEHLTPFKPASSFGDTINPYPSYEPPKVDAKPPAPKEKELIFKPAGVTGSFPIRSIVESNTPIAPPIWLRQALHDGYQNM